MEGGQADAGRGPGRDAGGSYAAAVIRRRILGRPTRAVPLQRPRGRGGHRPVGGRHDIGWLGPFGRQGGFTAWALWLGIHLFYLIGFANRIVVLVRWAWTFLTHGRGTRLITGSTLLPPIEEPEPPVHAPMDPEAESPVED